MDRYELNSTLGKISRSAVFLATEKSSNKKVALKLFSNPTEREKEKLLRDAQILQSVNHPNVVRILDAGVDEEGNVFYTMEYLDGIPLHHLVPSNKGLSFERSWPLIEGIIQGLNAIHEAGILHLDLKSGNVMVVQGQPKLIDFGFLIPKEPGNFRGTPGYVAPEIILGKRPTIQSDIYSLGALLAFMWTGHKLFQGDSPESTLAHQLKNLSQAVPQRDLAGIIQRATKQDPSRRYSHVQEVLKALSVYKHEQEYQAEEPNEDPTETQWGHWLIATTLITLICIAMGIYYSLLTSV